MKSISDYKSRFSNTSNVRDSMIRHSQHSIATFFKHSPSYETIIFYGEDEQLPCQIVSDTKIPTIKYIIMHPGLFVAAGQLIRRNDNTIWLCLNNDDNPIYSKGQIEKCISSLRWLNDIGEVEEIPFAISRDSLSNFGIDDGRLIDLPNERRTIVIPSNEATNKIKKNQRFIFDERAWKVTALNKLDAGLNYITLQEDLIADKDNIELRVADYYGLAADYKLQILGERIVAMRDNQSLRLSISLTNRGIPFEGNIVFTTDNPEIISIDDNGAITPLIKGSCAVTATYRSTSDTIQVNVIDSIVNNFNVTIVGDSTIKYNMTKTYTCDFTNNGIPITERGNFRLSAHGDSTTTVLATIIEQDPMTNQCKVKAGAQKGIVDLHVENETGLIKTVIPIEIKSLL